MRIKLKTSIELDYQANENCSFQLNFQPAFTPQQVVSDEQLHIDGALDLHSFTDWLGNRFVRFNANRGPVSVRYLAHVEISPMLVDPAALHELQPIDIPSSVIPFVLPSRYCESDKLMGFAISQFGALPSGYRRFAAIAQWVRSNVAFTSGASTSLTSAADTLQQRQGVCRDYANLTISLCRALNIPTRFVSGIDFGSDPQLGPLDFHAYVECLLGDRWYLIDPSGLSPETGLMRIGTGRDAAEVAFATIFGSVQYSAPRMSCEAINAPEQGIVAPFRTELAVSTASYASHPNDRQTASPAAALLAA